MTTFPITAAKSWGDTWQLPTEAQWKALIDNCTWNWKDSYSFGGKTMDGYLVTDGNNGNSIFLPAAGSYYRGNSKISDLGIYGYYWSSDYQMFFIYDSDTQRMGRCDQDFCLAVRPVSQ